MRFYHYCSLEFSANGTILDIINALCLCLYLISVSTWPVDILLNMYQKINCIIDVVT